MTPIARLILAVLICPLVGSGAVTFSFQYGAGSNFHEAPEGLDNWFHRHNLLKDVGTAIGFRIEQDAMVNIQVSYNNEPTGSLASAAGLYSPDPTHVYGGLLNYQITSGAAKSSAIQGYLNVNLAYDFAVNGLPNSSQYDLYSVLYHEMTHLLGVTSLFTADGGSTVGSHTIYDTFLCDSQGNRLIDLNLTESEWSALMTSGELYYDSANMRAANGGAPAPVYAPEVFAAGSSLSHLDFDAEDTIMKPTIAPGETRREWGALDVAMLRDLGYEISSVPEPRQAALLLGLFGLGYLAWRRRKLGG